MYNSDKNKEGWRRQVILATGWRWQGCVLLWVVLWGLHARQGVLKVGKTEGIGMSRSNKSRHAI